MSNEVAAPPTWKQHWPEFEETMRARLQQGHIDYGDGSFDRLPSELLSELAERSDSRRTRLSARLPGEARREA